jgi:hypothetical protein
LRRGTRKIGCCELRAEILVHEGQPIASQVGASVEYINDFKALDESPTYFACPLTDPGTRDLVVGQLADSFGDLVRGLTAARRGKWAELPVAFVC